MKDKIPMNLIKQISEKVESYGEVEKRVREEREEFLIIKNYRLWVVRGEREEEFYKILVVEQGL